MDKAQAINAFWSSFDLPAYDENTTPETAGYPRLTYAVSTGGFDEVVVMTASLWYRTTGWAMITQKADAIADYIGPGGHLEPYDGGAVWITRGAPFAQRMSDPDGSLRRIVLTVYCEYLTE